MATPPVFQVAVEGDLDEAVLRCTAEHLDISIGNVYGRQGKQHLEANIGGYNSAAQHWPWVVLVDLDHSHECAADLRGSWLPDESPFMCLRVAVRQVEAWLLADLQNTAAFLGVKRASMPTDPDSEVNSKSTLVRLAERSNRRLIREGLVPSAGGGRQVGPLSNPILRDFVRKGWSPTAAAERSESLRRSLLALDGLRSDWLKSAGTQ
jgi:hypothetical protein